MYFGEPVPMHWHLDLGSALEVRGLGKKKTKELKVWLAIPCDTKIGVFAGAISKIDIDMSDALCFNGYFGNFFDILGSVLPYVAGIDEKRFIYFLGIIKNNK